MEIEDFKSFIRTIPSIREDVMNGKYTWQQLYEFYVLYGKDDKMWDTYRTSTFDFKVLLEILKNIDLDALSRSFDGIQKILDLLTTFIDKKEPAGKRQWYDD